jgi:uncharacterized repeat protein (TIGR03803 family)
MVCLRALCALGVFAFLAAAAAGQSTVPCQQVVNQSSWYGGTTTDVGLVIGQIWLAQAEETATFGNGGGCASLYGLAPGVYYTEADPWTFVYQSITANPSYSDASAATFQFELQWPSGVAIVTSVPWTTTAAANVIAVTGGPTIFGGTAGSAPWAGAVLAMCPTAAPPAGTGCGSSHFLPFQPWNQVVSTQPLVYIAGTVSISSSSATSITLTGGSAGGWGTVFKVDSTGNETVLHSFAGGANDGAYPVAGVILDAAGNLYGTTSGGFCCGSVYEIDGTTGQETILYVFGGGADGSGPSSELTFDAAGNLYGTTQWGGNVGQCTQGAGCGVVFKLSPQPNGTWTESTLYTFCSQKGCADGAVPRLGQLAMDGTGNLYGTTELGGAYEDCVPAFHLGCGVVYKLDPAGNETVLHSFSGGSDGASPQANVILDSEGNLYGTTELGGDGRCSTDPQGCGVVFEITP